jgi:hypothetical protein
MSPSLPPSPKDPVTDETAIVVADLGSRRAKSIRRLKQGNGRLLDDSEKLMQQLKVDGVVTEGAVPIIVVVKEKRRRGLLSMMKLKG